MDKPCPWLLRQYPPSLGASLCPVYHAPWALAMGSHIAERGKAEMGRSLSKTECPSNVKAKAGIPLMEERALVNPGDQ